MTEKIDPLKTIIILNSPLTKVSISRTEFLKKGPCINEVGSILGFACVSLVFGNLITGEYFKPCVYDRDHETCPLNEYRSIKSK